MYPLIRRLAVVLMFSVTAGVAVSADSAPTTRAPDKLAPARELIAEKKWAAAIAELQRVNDRQNADWNNLMGYSLRKSPAADLDGAERFYEQALQVDPKHRGALEYSGELYLIKGDLPKAEQRLAALDKACTFSCEEYRELKTAVKRFKDNGNKYVAAP